MCCGSRRWALRNPSTPLRARSAAPLVPQGTSNRAHIVGAPGQSLAAARGSSPLVILHYTETSAIRVRGQVTGRTYDFSGARPDQAVDPRDAAVLTPSALFRRA